MAQPATRNLGRLSEIAQVAVRHGFGYWFETHRLTDLFPRRGPRVEVDGQPSQRGQHLREMLDELGPTFVKFGQLLSTRPDVLPPDIIAELRGLQDDVRPVPLADIEKVIEEDLGLTVQQLFSEFEERPVAAASIGQVHRATLPNGKRVAVKVQRPGAPRQIEADLALLYQAARIAKGRVRALDPPGARLPPRGAQRRRVPSQLRRPPARPCPARLLDLHAQPGTDAGMAGGNTGRRHPPGGVGGRGSPGHRLPDGGDMDDHDLPS